MQVTRSDFLKLSLSTLGSVYFGCSNSVGSSGGGAGDGSLGTGGATTGGAATGGATSGGASSGGASTGGANGSTGGATNTGGAATGGSSGGAECSMDISVKSSGSHTHDLKLTVAQLSAATEVELTSTTTFEHSHKVLITAADFAKLKAGQTITKTTCDGGDHEFVLACGTPDREPGEPTCCSGDSAAACPN